MSIETLQKLTNFKNMFINTTYILSKKLEQLNDKIKI